MVSSEQLSAYVREYALSRLRDPVMAGWVGGSIAFMATMYVTSSGRQLAKAMPPPRMRRIQGTILRGNAESEAQRDSDTNASAGQPSAPMSPASPTTRAAGLSTAIASATEAAAAVYAGQVSQEASVLDRFVQLLRIAVPNYHGREARSIYILFVLMLARAYVSVRIVDVSGQVSRTAIEGNLRHAIRALVLFGVSCVPATLLNVTLDYYSELLELHFRENLAAYFSDRYLKRRVFFHLAGLHEVDRVDQRITEDVRNWARVSAALFTTIPRPLIEAITFSFTLARQTGWKGAALAWSYYFGFAVWVVCYAPDLDWMVEQRVEKEGAVRAAHQSLLTHAEEVTVTKGFPYQEQLLRRLFKAVTDQSRYAAFVRARFNFSEILYNKYGSVLLGYVMCAMAAMHQKSATATPEDSTATLTRASYTFKTLAMAIGRFMWNIKLILIVGGYTRRLSQFAAALDRADVLVELQTDRTAQSPAMRRASGTFPVRGRDGRLMINYEDSFGRIVRGEHIEFVDVPLVLPTGECLCDSMSFFVKPGMNLLIIGRNGCGKSSTFRLLGELWPLRGGRIVKPEAEQLYYVPQRPYMFDGTLLEQVIYPLKRKDLTVGEAELYGYLQMAGLDYVFTKSNMSWETRLSWSDDALSLGEQQRLAMARLFFHRPRFAILDECSSLIDLDVERQMYDRCVELGITVITIAHRRSVWQYHNWILYFDGNGGYTFSPLQYRTGDSALVLTAVRLATDAAVIGTEVRVPVADRLCAEDEAAAALSEATGPSGAPKSPAPKPARAPAAVEPVVTASRPPAPASPQPPSPTVAAPMRIAAAAEDAAEEEEEPEEGGHSGALSSSRSAQRRRSRRRRSQRHRGAASARTVAFAAPADAEHTA